MGRSRHLGALAAAAAVVWLTPARAAANPDPGTAASMARQSAAPTLQLKDAQCAAQGSDRRFTLASVARPGDDPAAATAPVDVTCRFAATTPPPAGDAAPEPHLLRVRALARDGLLSVVVTGTAPSWPSSDHRVELGSDGAVEAQELLVPAGFTGEIAVRRFDLGPGDLGFEVQFDTDTPTPTRGSARETTSTRVADRGQSLRAALETSAYRDLVALARTHSTRQHVDADLKDRTYLILTTLIARDASQWRNSATRSEPIVAFIGLAGMTRIVLADAVAWPMKVSFQRAGRQTSFSDERLAEPWQTTFERAQYLWVMYVEDEGAPYFTSIDARFTNRAESDDHEDFDPQGVSRWDLGLAASDTVRVRIGYKRFRIPERLNGTQVTFSRQSSTYGLRQWSARYSRYGRYPVRVAASLMGGFPSVKGRDFELTPVHADDSLTPGAYSLEEKSSRQPIFILAAVRFPQLRESERQTPLGWSRLWRSLVPEPVIGLGLPTINRRAADGEATSAGVGRQSLALGFSWPIYGERVHFVAAAVRFHEAQTREGAGPLVEGTRYPIGTTIDDVRDLRAVWKPLVGLSIDLARTW
jgi:hypothetical protein